MIPAIALMIAVYGSARLFNDCLDRSESNTATILMWLLSAAAMAVLWTIAIDVVSSGLEL